MNILITGIHGFIGSNFIRTLRDKHTLYGLDIIFPCRDGVIQTYSWRHIEPTSFPFQILPRNPRPDQLRTLKFPKIFHWKQMIPPHLV